MGVLLDLTECCTREAPACMIGSFLRKPNVRENLLFIGLLLLLTPLSIMVTGYGVYLENHAMQLPLVQMLNDPGRYYEHDPYAQSLLKYGAPVWHLTAWLVDRWDLEDVLAVLFVIGRVLALAGAGCLARVLAPGSRVALVAAMVFIAAEPKPLVGAGTILEKIFEHTSLGIGCFLLAFAAALARRPWAWAVAWVLGFYCNPMYGIFASVYLGLYVLAEPDFIADWRRWRNPLIAALALIGPLMAWSLFSMRPQPYDHDVWFQVAMLRLEHHMNPLAWSPLDWLLTMLLIGFAAWGAWRSRDEDPRLTRFLGAAAVGCVLWLGAAFVAIFIRNHTLLVMHAGRGSDLFYLFATIGLIAVLVPRGVAQAPMPPALVLLLILIPGYFHGVRSLFYFLLIPLMVYVWKLREPVSPRLAIALLIGLFAMLGVTRQILERGGDLTITVGNDVRKIGQWAREETPRKSVFLVDPEWEEFRAIARRSVFVTWKDAGAIPWQRDYASEWIARLRALGADVLAARDKGEAQDDVERAWEELTDERVTQLARDYGIDYWIVHEDKKSRFREVYDYGDSRVLKVGGN